MYSNSLKQLLTFHPGQTRQASSYGRDPQRGGTWFGFRPEEALIKRVMLKPGEKHVMASIDGPGIISRIFTTTLLPFNAHALKSLTLRFFWDGEKNPSVESPFGDFFGAPFGSYQYYVSEPLCLTSGAYISFWPMPFHTGARLEIINEGSKTVEPFFYNITYQELEEEPPSSLRFHANWLRENPTRPDSPFTILDVEGKGHYVGCHINMQNLEWWLRYPIKDILFPLGFGMGLMEGWESIYVDGEDSPSVIGTGTEDFFNGAWYYTVDGTFTTPHYGCLVRDYARGRVAAYRYEINSPISFTKSIKILLDHGFKNRMKCDFSRTSYWYQEEPHQSYPSLPPVNQRKPTSSAANLAQAIMLIGPPTIAVLAIMWKLAKRLLNRSKRT
jgi:hypothetical protein